MNLGCCDVAIASLICHVIGLGIYAGYTIRMKEKQIELEKNNREIRKELSEVERVNGKEKRDIAELQREMKELKEKLTKN